jgi:hypothetical protein
MNPSQWKLSQVRDRRGRPVSRRDSPDTRKLSNLATALDAILTIGRRSFLRFEENISSPSEIVYGAVAGAAHYFIANSTGGLRIDGVNLSNGISTSDIQLLNVADENLSSAELYAAGPTLIVASYSPDLSYTACKVDGSEMWSVGFPNAAPQNASLHGCPAVRYQAIGYCDTLLSPPFLYGNGSTVLLSASPSVLAPRTSYHNSYRLVALINGAIEWKSDYEYTFEMSLPWTEPEPGVVVEAVIDTEVICTVVTSTSGAGITAGGTL